MSADAVTRLGVLFDALGDVDVRGLLPVRRVVPRSDVAGLRLAGVVLGDSGDPRLAEHAATVVLHSVVLHHAARLPTSSVISVSSRWICWSVSKGAKFGCRPRSLRAMTP